MSNRTMTISLPDHLADLLERKAASRGYSSEGELVADMLRDLEKFDAATERWLREDVARAYDAHKANPTAARPLREVRERLSRMMDRVAATDVSSVS